MKKFLRLGAVMLLAGFLITGCTKTFVAPQQAPIVGSWVLDNAATQDAYGWQVFNTGLENGVFDFYSNGAARFSDGNSTMQGTWLVQSVNGAYYDNYGNYHSGVHNTLELHLADNYSHSTVDLYFDDVDFGANYFAASYYDNDYVDRYTFSRY